MISLVDNLCITRPSLRSKPVDNFNVLDTYLYAGAYKSREF